MKIMLIKNSPNIIKVYYKILNVTIWTKSYKQQL